MKKVLSLVFLCCMSFVGYSQFTALSATGDGGFETGTTLPLNGWTNVDATGVNRWYLGTVPGVFAGARCAYVSNNGGVSWNYTNSSVSASHFYRDVTIPSGAANITLSFYYKTNGENASTPPNNWDQLLVHHAPTTFTPTANNITGTTSLMPGASFVFGSSVQGAAPPWTLVTATLPSTYAGSTVRIIFTWKSDGSLGTPPPAAVDNISVTYAIPACDMSGTYSVGPTGTYPTLASAITALQNNGVNGPVALELQTTYTGETYPVTIGSIPCLTAINNLTIRPQGPLTISATSATPIISLNGARFVTVDGRVGSTGSTKALTIQNSSTTGQVVQFINDASDNVFRYCTLRGSNTSTVSGVVWFSTTNGLTGNDNNLIDNCDILDGLSPAVNNIYSAGTTTVGLENSGNTISNCNIANFYSSTSATNGVFLTTGNSNWTISNNRFYQTAPRSYLISTTHRAIQVSSTAGNAFSITGNIIGFSASNGTGVYTMTGAVANAFQGISLNAGNVSPSSIQGNTVTAINITGTSGLFTGIVVGAGTVNLGTIAGNIIGATAGTGAIVNNNTTSIATNVLGISVASASPAIVKIRNNFVGGINVVGASAAISSGITGIQITGTGIDTVSNNIVGSLTTPNSLNAPTAVTTAAVNQQMVGILCAATGAGIYISGNTVANMNSNGTAPNNLHLMAGIIHQGASVSPAIVGNVVRDLSSATSNIAMAGSLGGLTGIAMSAGTNSLIADNTVNALVATNTTAANVTVVGIGQSGGTTPTVTRNKIYDLRNANTGITAATPPKAVGINIGTGVTAIDITNNSISLGSGQTTNTSFTGIMNNTSTTATLRIYYNTINITGAAAAGALPTAGFNRGNYSATAITTPVDIRNNLFNNSRTGGTGIHYAIANGVGAFGTNTGWGANASNFNILNAPVASAVGFWGGANMSFAAWKSGVGANSDANSYTASAVTFVNEVTGNLHINMGTTANNIESHGVVIPGFTTDIDNETRPGPAGSVNGYGTAPDIGADEFDGVATDNISPVITYSAILPGCGTGDKTFSATIFDNSGVPTTGGLVPRVYFRKNGGTWFSNAGTLSTGTGISGTWSFSITAATMGGLAISDIVQFYVIAQDINGFIGSSPSAGLVATNVNTVTTAPSTPNSYTVLPTLGGTFTVGTGGDYNTITLAAAAYNTSCLSGPVVFNLISTTYPTETFPITIQSNIYASSTNTLTIKPATGTAATITGIATSGLFKLLNASYVTIDGVNTGGASLTLTNNNTGTGAVVHLASTSGVGPGNNNVSIKNTNIIGGSVTTTTSFGIVAGVDGFPSITAGMDNDNITISGNNIQKCYYAISCNGTANVAAGGLNNLTITNNTIGPVAAGVNNIGFAGIAISNALNVTVTGNTLRNIVTTTASSGVIRLNSGVNGYTITQNLLQNCNSTSTGSGATSFTGILLGNNVINGTITRNTLTSITNSSTGGWGVRGIMFNTLSGVSNTIVSNNMISDIWGYSDASNIYWPIGIAIEGANSGGISILHNSISLFGPHAGLTSATGAACIFINTGTGSNLDIRNNMLLNSYDNTTSATDKSYTIYTLGANTAFSPINYNDYYVSGAAGVMGFIGSDRTNLAGMIAGFGGNANSINVNPITVSTTNLRMTAVGGNVPLIAGTPIASVTLDIDGTTRSGTTPVIGAHEVNIPSCSTPTSLPTSLSYTSTSTSTTVNFTAATPAVDGYILVASSGALVGAPTAGQAITTGTAVGTNGTIVGVGASSPIASTALAPNTNYTMTLFPYNNACLGGPLFNTTAPSAVATTCPNTPAAPVAGVPTGNTIPITFTDPAAGGGAYSTYTYLLNVYIDAGLTVPATGYPLAGTSITGSPYTITGLNGGTTYYFTVTAISPACSSAPSAAGSATTVVVPCTGTPPAGVATSSASTVLGAAPFTLSVTGGSGESALAYQWQSSTCLTTWGDIGGATGATLATTQAVGTYYRRVTTCTNSGLSASSVPVYVTSYGALLCGPASLGSCSFDYFTTFNLTGACGTSFNSTGGTCTANAYDDKTAITPVKMYPGASYTGNVVHSDAGDRTLIWIDFNNNGSFGDAGEQVVASAIVGNVGYTINIPAIGAGGSAYGIHRMRLRLNWNTVPTLCGAQTYSMIRDYTVQIVPNPAVTSNSPFCGTGSLTLTATSNITCGGTYTWSGPSGYTSSAVNLNTVSPTLVAGVYSLALTANGVASCPSPGTTNVVVNALPTVFNVTGGGAYCSGGSGSVIGLSGSQAGVNYQLKDGAANVGAPVAGTGSAISFPAQTVASTYSVVATNPVTSCTSDMTGSVSISINPSPAATTATGPVTAVCNSATISASNGGDGTMYFQNTTSNGTSILLGGTPQTVTASGTYYFRAQSAGGCFGPQGSVIVTVNPNPDVSNLSTSVTSQCLGLSTTATVNSTSLAAGSYTATYNLSGANSVTGATASFTIAANTGSFSVPSASLSAAGTTTLTITSIQNNTTTCSSTPGSGNTGAFSVNALPATVTTAGGGTSCNSASISGSNGGDGTIFYQGTTSGGTSEILGGSPQTVSANGTYYFRAKSSAGCWGNEGSVTVSINPLPAAVTGTGAGTFCGNTSISGSNGGDGTIFFQGTTSGGTSESLGGSPQTVTSSGTYYFRAKSAAGCWGAEGSVIVVINSLPAAVTGSGGGTFCGNTAISGSNGGDGTIFYQGTTSGGTSTVLGGTPQTVAASGTYYFRAQSSAGCWGTEGSVTVSVNPIPTAAPSNNGPICNGGTATLSANPATGANSYSWSGPDGFNSIAENPSVTPTVTSTYSLQVTNGSGNPGCAPSTVYVTTVTVRSTPTAAPTNDGPICNSGTVALAANPAGGSTTFSWSGPDGFTSSSPTPSLSPTVTGVYSVTVSDGSGESGCSPSTVYTTSVTVKATPSASPTNNGYICNGGTVTLTANPGANTSVYSWTGTSLSSASAQNPTATPIANTVYTLTVSDGSGDSGCSPTTEYTTSVVVHTTPVASPTNDGPICNGGTVTLTANPSGGATNYNWSGSSLSSATAANPTATPTATTVYSLQVSDGSTQPGCAPTTIYVTTVSVNPTPTAAPTNDGPICVGGTVALSANPGSGASTYSWSGPGGFTSTNENPTATPTASGVYSVLVTDGTADAGCSPSTIYTTSVTVKATPSAAPTNNGYICNGGAVTLTANPGANTSVYSWTGTSLSSASAQNPTSTPTTNTIYTLTVSDGSGDSGCSPTTEYTTSVVVHSTPIASPTNSAPICNGGTVTLTAAPSGGANTYIWSGSSLSSASAENPTATPTSTTVYSLQVTDGSSQPGCAPATVYTTSVTVKATPVASPTNNGYICIGGTATLTANPSGGANTYVWSGPASFASAVENPTATPTVTGVYSLTVSDGTTDNGCAPSTIYTTTVSVNPMPVAAPTNSGVICNGGTSVLNANPADGANTYMWSGSSLLSTTAANPTATPGTGTHVYSLQVSDGSAQPGCAPATVYTTSVTVNDAPTLTSATNDGQVCEGITLNFSANGAANVTGYSWAGPVVLTNPLTATPSIPGSTTAATGLYTVTVNNGTGSGCTATYTTSATVNLVPSVASITPSTTNVCVGTAVTFTAGAPTGAGTLSSYNWSGPNSFSVATATNTATLTPLVTGASGVYSLTVTYPGTGCTSPVASSANVTVNNLPTLVSIGATPGTMCAGAVLSLTANGAAGAGSVISYNWTGPNSYSSSTALAVQTYATPNALASGSYSVRVTFTGTGCTSNPVASSVVTVNPLPTQYNITGGGFYCALGTGVNIGVEDTDPGITYQLYNGSSAVGVPIAGTGSAIDFGEQLAAGTYSVVATNNVTLCTNNMNGTTDVNVGTIPNAYTVTGGGGYCAGGAGVGIGLSASDNSVSYQLYKDGVATGGLVLGDAGGGPITFGLFTLPGNYTVIANPSATCARTMNGSASVSINPLPNIYTVSGGGTYCSAAGGVHIVQDFSVVGINYQLYNGSTAVGSPVPGASSGIDFGLQTVAGTYSVLATNATTGCTQAMTGMPTVSVNASPSVYTLSGGGAYCSGSGGIALSLSNSTSGISYQVYNGATATGAAVSGTGALLPLGTFTASGTYSVLATNTVSSCTSAMSGTATVLMQALPVVYTMTGGGTLCAGTSGVHVGLNHGELGINYQLYNGSTAVGSPSTGAFTGVDFGLINTAGTYTVRATNAITGCSSGMGGSATVVVNPLPVAQAVTGGGGVCADGGGQLIGLGGSVSGVTYQLYRGAVVVGTPVSGNGLAISLGSHNTPGTYTVQGTVTATGCVNSMSGSAVISINATPAVQSVTGGGNYCAGSTGQSIGLSGSETGIQYQLYNGSLPTGSAIAGDGSALSFGVFTTSGTYTVVATNTTTLCARVMSGSATIIIDALPGTFSVTGGGTYCAGGAGVNVGLSGSAAGVNYQLYRSGSATGSAVSGTGSSVDFGLITGGGVYTVSATDAVTGCTNAMSGGVTVAVQAVPGVHTVTGGGNYCAGGAGSVVGLDGSAVGINYQLYRGGTPVGSAVAGTGVALSFPAQTIAGSYSVVAMDGGSSCTSNMTGSVTVGINAVPSSFAVTGGGSYCSGGSGVAVGLFSSQNNVNYRLYHNGVVVGGTVPGTGSALGFGLQTAAGTYSVAATDVLTGCLSGMTGTVSVVAHPLPVAYAMNGGGSYCAGGTGVHIGMDFTASGVDYQLILSGSPVGAPFAGANSSLDFGLYTTGGTYSVRATNATTGCLSVMSGSATVVVNALPVVQAVSGGGSYCNGGSGVAVGLSSSESGISYVLYNGGSATGIPVTGTGGAVSFGNQPTAGVYTVMGTNTATGCTQAMSGSATVVVNALPVLQPVTGGGTLCSGAAGVTVGLSGSETGISYQLYKEATATGAPLAGTGSALSYGTFTTAGIYTVQATNTVTGCVRGMSGGALVVVNALPVVQSVTGGGSYCNGGSGHAIGLSGTETGITYTLYRGATMVSSLAGSGSAISFGAQTVAGSYSVSATNTATGCSRSMSGTATIVVNALPVAQSVTGGGHFCAGGAGVSVGLSGSSSGISYQLYQGTGVYGPAVTGTGSVLSFGTIDVAGTYTVRATNIVTGCVSGMSGSTEVVIDALPVVQTVTGGGSYCSGSGGVVIGMGSSETGISYQLYNGTSASGSPLSGTGSALSFGTLTAGGTYSVRATNAVTGCVRGMSGSAVISVLPLPVVYTVTGGGAYCVGGSGVNVGLTGSSNGISYQLYQGGTAVGGAVEGTGMTLDFGLQTGTGTYSVSGTNIFTGCISPMSGVATVGTNALPATQVVTGGGGYCSGGAGVAIGLGGTQSGVNYQLYRGAVQIGSAVAGSGSTISFGAQLVAGTYTVLATNNTTGCVQGMPGAATVVIHSLPSVFGVTGGGSYCSGGTGVVVGLSGSGSGIQYLLYNGSSVSGAPVSGTGSGLSFGLLTAAGTYSVRATNAVTGCVSGMSGSTVVVVNALPVAQTVTGGGSYCAGGTGVSIGLSTSQPGVSYSLYNGATVVSTVSGTGTGISFGPQVTASTYSVTAVHTTTGCINTMSGSAVVGINALPVVQTVTGGGAYCAGSTGVHIGLGGSEAGISYQLYRGTAATGSAVSGSGGGLDFGLQLAAGTYSVSATNSTTGCSAGMSGSTAVTVNALPVAQTITGGGAYCAGGNGVLIGLSGSQSGVSYQLYNGSSASGAAGAGTGGALSFGLKTSAGTYTVLAVNPLTTCSASMNGSAAIVVNALPVVQTVTGGGTYCAGGSGFAVGLSGSSTGVSYQLYNGGSTVGGPMSGTGSVLSFGVQTLAGTYTVLATNGSGCTKAMSGSGVINVNALPVAQTVTGGGAYCAGGNGVSVGLGGSQTGVQYQLYLDGFAHGATQSGTGGSLDFGLKTIAGSYSVQATNPLTGCATAMVGMATVVVNALPATQNVLGGGAYCAGGNGVFITLSGSQAGVQYRLYNGGTAVGSAVSGTGTGLSFGLQTAAGTYTVLATNAANSCALAMTGSASITINPLPTTYALTGGGSYCSDGNGVLVGLSGSSAGISYQLYLGTATSGSAAAGTGSAISFGLKTAAGIYSVQATNSTTGCSAWLPGTSSVVVNAAPAVYAVTGGGNYCTGTNGVAVGLDGSASGVSYQLYLGSVATGAQVTGTGGALSFGQKTAVGIYTVRGVHLSSSCSSTMSGSAEVSVSSLPVAQTVTGGGSYCADGTGVSVALSNSAAGVQYQLYHNGAASGTAVAGTGSGLDFGPQTAAGVYSVQATDMLTGCGAPMTGSAAVVVNALPAVHTVSGGGSYCAGGSGMALSLSGSNTGISYKLYNGSTATGVVLAGTGSGLNLGTYTATGTYTVSATNNSTGCVSAMSGSGTIMINALPVVQTMTGGGTYCAGGTGVGVGLGGSEPGVQYQLYRGTTAVGAAVAGTGNALSFGQQTAAGVYTVGARNAVTSCERVMTGSSTVVVADLPVVNTVSGGGAYCAGGGGLTVTMDGSQSGVSYQLYRNGTAVGGTRSGTGFSVDFGMQTAAGTYTVMATSVAQGCVRAMAGSSNITVNALPAVQTVSGGGSYCAGGTGVAVGLSGSEAGMVYTLYNGADVTGSAVTGTGSGISFGAQTAAGSYTVKAEDAVTGCSTTMSGSASVVVNALPEAQTVLSSGSAYCAGGAGIGLTLSGSQSGVSYQLYQGTTASGSAVSGTGSTISFGNRTAAGMYHATATNTVTGCSSSMSGSAVVSINPLPAVQTVSGGGAVCAGGAGVAVNLSGSEAGVQYTLRNGTTTVGSAVAGTGAAISFGSYNTAGNYTIQAANAVTGCVRMMAGAAGIVVNELPFAYNVTGGGSYCAGGTGVPVGLSGSSTSVAYQLYRDGTAVGSAISGTGSAISFGSMTSAGEYSVTAINNMTTCAGSMSGSAMVVVNALPESFAVNGGGGYCAGSGGTAVGLSGSAAGVTYRLYRGSSLVAGSSVSGTGGALTFGMMTAAGVYSVSATDQTTGCSRGMSGTTAVSVNALPALHSISGGGSYCAGGAGVEISIGVSEAGVSYQLYQGGMATGSAVMGTGGMISFGAQTAEGTYTVLATNAALCSRAMPGTASVSITPLTIPSVSVAAGATGTICSGTGVTFTATAVNGGTAPAYQWQVNGTDAGTGAATYSYAPADGDVVGVRLTSSAACPSGVATATVAMTVTTSQTPTVSIVADNSGVICKGASVTFTATSAFGGDAPVYAWMKNGVFKGSGLTYTVAPEDGDAIYCVLTSNYVCRTVSTATSNVTTMEVMEPKLPTIVVTTDAGAGPIKEGEFVTFQVTVTDAGDFPEYQWLLNGEAIAGATTLTFVTNQLKHMDSVTCRILTSGPCGGTFAYQSIVINISNVGVVHVADADMAVRVVPNPNNGVFAVQGTLGTTGSEDAHLEITNMLGQVIYRNTVRSHRGSIDERIVLDNAVSNGMYLISVTSGDRTKVLHVTVSR